MICQSITIQPHKAVWVRIMSLASAIRSLSPGSSFFNHPFSILNHVPGTQQGHLGLPQARIRFRTRSSEECVSFFSSPIWRFPRPSNPCPPALYNKDDDADMSRQTPSVRPSSSPVSPSPVPSATTSSTTLERPSLTRSPRPRLLSRTPSPARTDLSPSTSAYLCPPEHKSIRLIFSSFAFCLGPSLFPSL
jgi:hypothetical protein